MQSTEEKFRVYKLMREVDRVVDEGGLLMARIMCREGRDPGLYTDEQLWHSLLFTWQVLNGSKAETSDEFLRCRSAGTGLEPEELKQEIMQHFHGLIMRDNVENPDCENSTSISSFIV